MQIEMYTVIVNLYRIFGMTSRGTAYRPWDRSCYYSEVSAWLGYIMSSCQSQTNSEIVHATIGLTAALLQWFLLHLYFIGYKGLPYS